MIKNLREKVPVSKHLPTTFRVLLFCLLCAAALAVSSGFIRGNGPWFQVEVVVISAIGALILTITFAYWEAIKLKDIGIVPNRLTFSRYLMGLGTGLILATLQPA